MGWVVNATPRPFYPQERPGTHSTGGWAGPRASLDGCGKSLPHRDSIPGPSRTVASRCTDNAIRRQLTTHLNVVRKIKNVWSYNYATPSPIFLRRLVPFYHLMPYRMALYLRKVSVSDPFLKVSRKLGKRFP